MKVLVTGDSHIGALKRAQDAAADQFGHISFRPLGSGLHVPSTFFEYDPERGTVTTTVERWNNMTFTAPDSPDRGGPDFGPDLLIVSLPLNTNRILRDYSWHSHVPWDMQRSTREIALSDAVVGDIIDQDSSQAIAFLKALQAIGLNVAVLEGPRHFPHSRFLKHKRADVCMAIETRYRARVCRALVAAGIPMIAQPAQTVDAQGRTHADFRHENPEDTNHASAKYGGLALESIGAYVKSL